MVRSQYHGLSGQQLIKFLHIAYGAQIISQRGSHIKIEISSGVRTIVPDHKTLDYGTFSGIIKQLAIDETSLLNLINK